MKKFSEKYSEEIDRILTKYPPEQRRSAVMPLLLLAQREEGYVSRESIRDIAEKLGITKTQVASIIGFYTLFYEEKTGRYRIQVCTDIACALRGADQFFKELCEFLDVAPGETTADGLFTIEEVMCLASCHNAPMFQVQSAGEVAYHDHQTLETAKAFIEEQRNLAKCDRNAEKETGT
ncbi:MAG: NADH-quinone oxidoreductase subunit NuoE [Anaerolineaceae bacterium]|nr:NADH-quinone oxidoreductase subunit NuoE [Anaerolineaceae bacterium]